MGTQARAVVASIVAIALSAPMAFAATTHDEYVAQVSPICKDAAQAAKRIPKKIKSTGDPTADSLLATKAFGKLLAKTTRRIAAIQPDPADADAARAWIKGLRLQKSQIDTFLSAIAHGNAKLAKSMIRRISATERRNGKRAANLGLTACARGGHAG
jgi:hypothetical protein